MCIYLLVCTYVASWYWSICYCVLGGFILIWLALLIKFIHANELETVPYLISLNIVSMGTIAALLYVVFDWGGGICIDTIGVASPAAVWGDWMACGPLLVFITLTLVDKPELIRMDYSFIGTFFLSLILFTV